MGATHFTYDVSEFPLTERIQSVSLAQSVPVDQPSQRLALVNARAVTMNPEREVIPQATVLIENDRIMSVGAASDIEVPAPISD